MTGMALCVSTLRVSLPNVASEMKYTASRSGAWLTAAYDAPSVVRRDAAVLPVLEGKPTLRGHRESAANDPSRK